MQWHSLCTVHWLISNSLIPFWLEMSTCKVHNKGLLKHIWAGHHLRSEVLFAAPERAWQVETFFPIWLCLSTKDHTRAVVRDFLKAICWRDPILCLQVTVSFHACYGIKYHWHHVPWQQAQLQQHSFWKLTSESFYKSSDGRCNNTVWKIFTAPSLLLLAIDCLER